MYEVLNLNVLSYKTIAFVSRVLLCEVEQIQTHQQSLLFAANTSRWP